MDLKTVLAAAPLVRKAWKVLPGSLRLPVAVAAAAAAVWYVRSSRQEERVQQAS